MSPFLRLTDGALVAVASVGTISPADEDGEREVHDSDGELLGYATEHEVEALERKPSPTLPAAPGWHAFTYIYDGRALHCVSRPIVGWWMRDGHPHPITVDGVTPFLDCFVLAPAADPAGNRAYAHSYKAWPDERAAIEEIERREAAKAKNRAAEGNSDQ